MISSSDCNASCFVYIWPRARGAHSALSEPAYALLLRSSCGGSFRRGGFCIIKRLILNGQPRQTEWMRGFCSANSGGLEPFAHASIATLTASFGKYDVRLEIL